jgi:hypothetical protein
MTKNTTIRQLKADMAFHELKMPELAARCGINYNALRQGIYGNRISESRLQLVRAKLDEMIAEASTAQSEPAA